MKKIELQAKTQSKIVIWKHLTLVRYKYKQLVGLLLDSKCLPHP